MSRSYKKNPIWKCCGDTKWGKRQANHKVRRCKYNDIPLRGKGYKKLYESWDIVDYIMRWTWKDCLRWWKKGLYPKIASIEELKSWYKKNYLCK